MSEGESFDFRKLLSSPFTGIYWTKTVMFSLGALVILIIGFAVYKAYFKKSEPNQAIRAEAGSNVTIVQNNQKKRYVIPFVEGYAEQRSTEKMQTGIRGGIRVEF